MTPDPRERAVVGLDPWGLRRIEKLLVELDGVGSLKVVPDGHGGIEEIHVLSGSDLSPKQIVRNIESALLAEFGLQIDHRKISVARVKSSEIPVLAETAPPPEAPPEAGRVLLDGLQIERKAGQQVTCRVNLRDGDQEYAGEATGADYPKARLEVACQAVLDALEKGIDSGATLALEGVGRLESLGRAFIVVLIRGNAGRNAVSLAGIGQIHDSPEEAAVFASLQATNRWLQGR